MTTPPTTLHDRLKAELDRRLAVAKAATDVYAPNWGVQLTDTGWRACTPDEQSISDPGCEEIAEYVALHDPADAIRRYDGELQVLQQHTWSDRDKWRYGITCNGCPNSAASWPCPEIRSLAGRLGVSADG